MSQDRYFSSLRKNRSISVPLYCEILFDVDGHLLITIKMINYMYSIPNWIEDLHWKQLDLNYPGMPDAMVRVAINIFSACQ